MIECTQFSEGAIAQLVERNTGSVEVSGSRPLGSTNSFTMTEYAIEISQLNKRYDNGFVALRDVNLRIKKGDFFALLGPNGAGKSTTIGIISSLVRKTSGCVKIDGYDIDSAPEQAKFKLGVVPQEYNFNNFEKVENILLFQAGFYGLNRKTALERARHYLKLLDLWDKRNEKAMVLSGGMKRRLMIARAMLHQPEILILDEPTAGVDINLRRTLWDIMKPINESGTTIILTTHYLEEAEAMCRNVAIINNGQVIHNTSIRNLLSKLDEQVIVLDIANSIPKDLQLNDCAITIRDENSLEVRWKKNQNLNDIMQLLSESGLQVVSMRNKSNRLEEVFLKLTKN